VARVSSVLPERARSECARSTAAMEDTLATLPRSRPLGGGRRRKRHRSRIAVVAAGKTSELSQEQVKQHLVV